jgi:hypothetical protein
LLDTEIKILFILGFYEDAKLNMKYLDNAVSNNDDDLEKDNVNKNKEH